MTLTRISFQRSRRNLRLGVGDDPFLEDAGLEGLLGELANIETIDDLAKWRISVLGRYEAFVAPEGIETAREAERFLGGKLKEVVNAVAEVEKEIECGHISRDHVTVAGNSALKKLQSGSTELVQIISDFAPTSEENEKKVGYTRYQLGAVLLRDDFEVFELMRKTRNSICIIMDDCLVKALERTTKDHYIISFQHYIRQIQIFCDFLEAMDLYSVLAKIFKIFYQRDVAPPKVSYDLSGQVAFGSSDISLEMRGILSPTPGRHRLSAIAMAQESLGLSAKQSRRKLSPKGGKAKGFATLGNLPLVDAGDESKAPPLAMLSPGQVRAEISTLPLARARHEKITLATPLPLTGDSKFPVSPSKRISSDTSWIKASQAMGNP